MYLSDIETIEELTDEDKPMTARISEIVTKAEAWDTRGSDVL